MHTRQVTRLVQKILGLHKLSNSKSGVLWRAHELSSPSICMMGYLLPTITMQLLLRKITTTTTIIIIIMQFMLLTFSESISPEFWFVRFV